MQHQVLAHAEFAIQRKALRHKAHALARRQVLGIHRVAQQRGTAFGGRHQPGEDFHGSGFAAAVGTEKAEDLTAANRKADLVHRREIPKAQRQVVGFDSDIRVATFARRDHQRLVVVGAVTLEMSKGFIEFAAGCNGCQFAAQAVGDQLAAIEHQAMFELLGLFHVGGGHQQRQLWALAAHGVDQLPETPARQWVDAGGGLVENQQIRVVDQRAAQAELLFHTAGQLARRAFCEARKVGGQQQVAHALLAIGFGQAEQRGKETDVFADGQLRIQVAAQTLRHKRDARVQAIAVAAIFDGAAKHLKLACLQFLNPGDQPQQTRLARAVRADQPAAGTGRQAEGDVDQCWLLAVTVVDACGVQRQAAHCRLAGQSISAVRT
ncbi:hypothetical protein [Pseudomonas sp. 22 E 5]|nr:hypothetical protein [Pseudomonas sp. 22 E 5]